MTDKTTDQDCIAIIGMSGRFPGAANPDALWKLLKAGQDASRSLSTMELLAAGADAAMLNDPKYVRVAMSLNGINEFAAEFFGYSPRQAASMDPQQRLLLETAWEALEDAGYDSERYKGKVGVFASCSTNSY